VLTPLITKKSRNGGRLIYLVSAALFVVIAAAYLVQLWRLTAKLKADSSLWLRLGQPSLFTLSGQRTFDRVLYRPEQLEIDDAALVREIYRTKWLQLAGVLSFALVAITFFVGRAGAGA